MNVEIDQFFLGKWRLLPVFDSTSLQIDNFSYKIHIDEEKSVFVYKTSIFNGY